MKPAKIAIFRFASPLHGEAALLESHRPLLSALSREFEMIPAEPGQETEADLKLVFIASGGVEQKFSSAVDRLPRPLILLSDGRHNSLAASLEIMSWLRRRGEKPRLIHGQPDEICARVRDLVRFAAVRRALAGRIGLIGRPSDWLIGSVVEYGLAAKRWGTDFREIDIEEVDNEYAGVSTDEAEAMVGELENQALSGSVRHEEVVSAARLYPALKAVMVRHGLNAATVRCFDLLGSLGTTGCLALSRLCDEGLICGCEGDVAALFSMLVLFHLTGELPFMANPAFIDSSRGEITLAHCTVPLRAVTAYRLDSHFESGRGVGIAGEFLPGAYTLFKIGGPDLGKYFVGAGETVDGERDSEMCRTQIRLRFEADTVDYFFCGPLANHHVLVRGDRVSLIRRFMDHCSCRPVR